jgi:acyl-CoA synthetase (AMP-forming)/AMP-acid ligase II
MTQAAAPDAQPARRYHPSTYAETTPDKPAATMAGSGESRTFAELTANANRIASLLRSRGLGRGDVVAVLLPNCLEWFDIVWAALSSGMYLTPINWHLTAREAAYILVNCDARAVFAHAELADTVSALAADPELGAHVDQIPVRFSVGGDLPGYERLTDAIAEISADPLPDAVEGSWMFYSSGTTGQPKGIKPPISELPLGAMNPFMGLLTMLYGFDEETTYLCPAPLYHAAPAGWSTGTQRAGGTVVVMERFDPVEALQLIERHRVTRMQVVPTHLIRMLKLPEEVRARYDLSSLQMVVHAAAPCPVETKRAAIEWLGPILYEYYAASEGTGFCAISPEEWLAHPGSVGRSILGAVHILDEHGNELPTGEEGEIWFETQHRFSYHGDPDKTASVFNDRGWSTIGDVGRLDEEGYVYLTDRVSNMIISGGVNIYPREAEDVLVVHPAVEDVAVIGTPDPEMGEQVTAFVQLRQGVAATTELADHLIAHTRAHLSHFKCPREVRFVDELPRLPNGKLLKRMLKVG